MIKALPLDLIAVGVGVLVHNCLFRQGEWHMNGAKILLTHGIIFLGASLSAYWTPGSVQLLGFAQLLRSSGFYSLGLFGSIVVYRLFFHRLRNFPGPRLARITKLWHVYHVRDSTNHELLKKLHEKYGDVVRMGASLDS
jgi:hypothetical protein